MPDDFHADNSVVSIEPMIKSVPCQIIIIEGEGGGVWHSLVPCQT